MLEQTSPIKMLKPWASFAERYWYVDPQDSSRGCFGTGYNHWGVQTNQKYLAAMAVLAALGENDEGLDRQWALERALAALRFSLESHHSGPSSCTDGSQWGHTWISALGLERMMHGAALLRPHLGERELEGLQRVLTSEADWLLTSHTRGKHHGVFGDPWNHSGKNAPESNLWNGALLWRTAVLYPAHPHAEDWREQALLFMINGVSVPADEKDDRILDGKAIRERFRGANFFPNYALNHHGYMNVGYMTICVSNAAMLHFDMKAAGLPAPEALHHHQAELWNVLRRMVFGDGRLARIGGDSRVRYTYCQEYLLPSLLYAADYLGDAHALTLATAQCRLIDEEMRHNGDNSYYGRRLSELPNKSPYYYTRLESDRACVLGMAAAYLPLVKNPPKADGAFEETVAGVWSEPEHGDVLHRSPRRLASFSWRAYGLAQGMCQPPNDGHLADWEHNLGGSVECLGDTQAKLELGPQTSRRLLRHDLQTFEGGFLSGGALVEGASLWLADGWSQEDAAQSHLAVVALPDERTMLGLHYCRVADWRVYVRAVKGLHLNLPNDLYNGYKRHLLTAQGEVVLESPAKEELVNLNSSWANIEDRLGVVGLYGGQEISVHRSPQRRGGKLNSLYVDELCYPCQLGVRPAEPGEVVLDAGWVVLSSASADETAHFAAEHRSAALDTGVAEVRAVRVKGRDNLTYVFVANFAPEAQEIPLTSLLRQASSGRIVTTGETVRAMARAATLVLSQDQCLLLELAPRG